MVLNNNYCNQSIIKLYYWTEEDLVNLGLWRLGMNLYFIVSNLLVAKKNLIYFKKNLIYNLLVAKKKLHKKLKKQGNNLNK